MIEESRARYDLTIYKGATYTKDAWFSEDDVPMDFTGCSAKAQIRPIENSPMLTAEFDIDMEPTEGHIQLCLDADATARINAGSYVWDLQLVDTDGIVLYYIYGKVHVKGRTTV